MFRWTFNQINDCLCRLCVDAISKNIFCTASPSKKHQLHACTSIKHINIIKKVFRQFFVFSAHCFSTLFPIGKWKRQHPTILTPAWGLAMTPHCQRYSERLWHANGNASLHSQIAFKYKKKIILIMRKWCRPGCALSHNFTVEFSILWWKCMRILVRCEKCRLEVRAADGWWVNAINMRQTGLHNVTTHNSCESRIPTLILNILHKVQLK